MITPFWRYKCQSKRRKRQSEIDKSFFHERCQIVDALVGRMFYTGGMELDSLKES